MLDVIPNCFININDINIATGISINILTALLKWNRNTITTRLTIIASSTIAYFNVLIAFDIRSLLSYETSTFTPSGSPFSSSVSFSFTLSITTCGFSPYLITTIPPTTSPSPLRSSSPRRMSAPTCTVAMSFTLTGIPSRLALIVILSMSSTLFMYPSPLTKYSISDDSIFLPPTSLLLIITAFLTSEIDNPYAFSLFGSTSIWYCFTKPPTDATSATPSTDCRPSFR